MCGAPAVGREKEEASPRSRLRRSEHLLLGALEMDVAVQWGVEEAVDAMTLFRPCWPPRPPLMLRPLCRIALPTLMMPWPLVEGVGLGMGRRVRVWQGTVTSRRR